MMTVSISDIAELIRSKQTRTISPERIDGVLQRLRAGIEHQEIRFDSMMMMGFHTLPNGNTLELYSTPDDFSDRVSIFLGLIQAILKAGGSTRVFIHSSIKKLMELQLEFLTSREKIPVICVEEKLRDFTIYTLQGVPE